MKLFFVLMASLCLSLLAPQHAAADGSRLFADEGWILGDNFYEVDANKLYRSAQLSGASFEKYVLKHGIRTVINLRGPNPEDKWYRDEVEVLQRLNVNLIDIPMSARRLPHRKDLIALLEAYQNAPRPILIHCQAGADRTGEASALYQMLYMGKDKAEAIKMLAIKYGHIASMMPAKTYFIREVWQGIDWVYQNYDPCAGIYKHYDVNDPACQEP